jgi:predicted alpha-1,6-mannanase (GH76 family)
MAKKNVTRAKSKKTAELDAIYEGVMTCQPALLPSLVDEVAAAITDNEQMGVPWRITAVLAGKDGEFFNQVANDAETAKTMATIMDGLTSFSKRLEQMKKLADTVTCRLLVAGCNHEKFNDWVKEAA